MIDFQLNWHITTKWNVWSIRLASIFLIAWGYCIFTLAVVRRTKMTNLSFFQYAFYSTKQFLWKFLPSFEIYQRFYILKKLKNHNMFLASKSSRAWNSPRKHILLNNCIKKITEWRKINKFKKKLKKIKHSLNLLNTGVMVE